MFKKTKRQKFLIIFICFSSIVLVSLLWTHILWAQVPKEIFGWAWSENIGWISFHSENMDGTGIEYKLEFDPDSDKLIGYAWASSLDSYIQFSDPEGAPNFLGEATYNPDTDIVEGNALILNASAEDNEKKINLRGNEVCSGDCSPDNYPLCLDCDDVCIAEDSETGDCTETDYQCKICHTKEAYNGSGNICSNCKNCTEIDETTAECQECLKCHKYGVAIDSQTGRFTGWAWHGLTNNLGIGWIHFDKAVLGTGPWLQTKYGDIYSGQDVSSEQEPPFGRYNVTYCIHANGDITNFKSESGCADEDFGDINLPKESNKYTNVLGKLDLNKIESGDYGLVFKTSNFEDFKSEIAGLTEEYKIFHYTDSLTIDEDLSFINGTGADGDGRKLIIIDGDLEIKKNIIYKGETPNRLKSLASVGWIVKGDLIIDADVTEISGAFIVLGDDGLGGKVSTGTHSADPELDESLLIKGMMMARKFNFERQFADFDVGSEVVQYDGRLLSNTPPGMADIAKALPVWNLGIPPQ